VCPTKNTKLEPNFRKTHEELILIPKVETFSNVERWHSHSQLQNQNLCFSHLSNLMAIGAHHPNFTTWSKPKRKRKATKFIHSSKLATQFLNMKFKNYDMSKIENKPHYLSHPHQSKFKCTTLTILLVTISKGIHDWYRKLSTAAQAAVPPRISNLGL